MRTASFTGSSSFRRCSSTPTARACRDAGFDAVIGNPPWDMIRADAGRPTPRASRARRRRAGAPVHARCRRLHGAVGRPRQPVSAVRRARDGADAARRPHRPGAAVRPRDRSRQRARCGDGCSRAATSTRIVGIDNHRGVFPIHRSVRFLLLDRIARRADRGRSRAGSANGDPASLEAVGDEPADTSAWFPRAADAGAARTAVRRRTWRFRICAAPLDLAIVERAAVAVSAARQRRTGWAARFGRELNATDDRGAFQRTGRAVCRSSKASRSSRFASTSTRSRLGISAADARAPARSGTVRTAAARLPRRRQRHQPPDAHRRGAARRMRLDPHRLLPAHAAAAARPAFALRPLQQLRRQLPRAPARHHACDDGDRRAAADSAAAGGSGACREIAALARLIARGADQTAAARLQALAAGLYQLTVPEFEHVWGRFRWWRARSGTRR